MLTTLGEGGGRGGLIDKRAYSGRDSKNLNLIIPVSDILKAQDQRHADFLLKICWTLPIVNPHSKTFPNSALKISKYR